MSDVSVRSSGSLGSPRFYEMRSPGSFRRYSGHAQNRTRDELVSYSRAKTTPERVVNIVWGEGEQSPADIIWIGASWLVVSQAFIGVLSGFKGWSTYPVHVFDGRGELVEGYSGLAISGRCGRVYYDLTRVEHGERSDNYVGLRFDLQSWDGADICYPIVGPGPIVTEALVRSLRRAKMRNYRATELSKVRSPKEMVDRMIAARIGPYAPEDCSSN
jgi:hypothetical protein